MAELISKREREERKREIVGEEKHETQRERDKTGVEVGVGVDVHPHWGVRPCSTEGAL